MDCYHTAVPVALDKSEIKLYFSPVKYILPQHALLDIIISMLYRYYIISLLILEVQRLFMVYIEIDISVFFPLDKI